MCPQARKPEMHYRTFAGFISGDHPRLNIQINFCGMRIRSQKKRVKNTNISLSKDTNRQICINYVHKLHVQSKSDERTKLERVQHLHIIP